MKRLLTYGSIAALLMPSLSFAAYNDVTLTSSVSIQADGQTINVDGDSNVIEQMNVYDGTFTFTLDTNSEVTVKSASNKKLEHNAAAAHVVNSVCESGNSSIHFKGTADDITVTVTPKNTTCPEGSGSSGSSGSSGGGGTATVVAAVTPPPVQTSTREAQIATLLKAIAALQKQLNALIASGGVEAGVSASICPYIWTRNLTGGSVGEDVKKLQQFLNMDSSTSIAASGAGSSGNETTRFGPLTAIAVKKFQEKYASQVLTPSGLSSGIGRFGPASRAKANAICK